MTVNVRAASCEEATPSDDDTPSSVTLTRTASGRRGKRTAATRPPPAGHAPTMPPTRIDTRPVLGALVSLSSCPPLACSLSLSLSLSVSLTVTEGGGTVLAHGLEHVQITARQQHVFIARSALASLLLALGQRLYTARVCQSSLTRLIIIHNTLTEEIQV